MSGYVNTIPRRRKTNVQRVATKDCPCQGKKGYTWHSDHNLPHCQHSYENRREYRINKQLGWRPGSPIDIPEIDPL